MVPKLPDAARFESDAAFEGVPFEDIHMSRLTGMAPADIEYLRMFTISEALLIIIRCPRRAARYWHGKFQPKTMMTDKKLKSGNDGLVHLPNERFMVSDYDLMSVFRMVGPADYEKIFFSGIDPANKRSRLNADATKIIRKANSGLMSPFQHGAQDDYTGPDHPNCKPAAKGAPPVHFIAFNVGSATYLSRPEEARDYYAQFKLPWPYDADGMLIRAG